MAKFVCLSGTREGTGKVVVQPAHPESDLPPGGALEWASSPPAFSVGHMRVESPSTAPFSIYIANFHRLNAHTYNFFKSGTRFVIYSLRHVQKSFSGGSYGKESARNAGDLGLIPGLERSPREGHGNTLQCSCQENPMDRGAWWSTVHGVKVGGEGDDRGWDGWMASLTQRTWVWVGSRSWWWTGKPCVLQSMGAELDTTEQLNWTEVMSNSLWPRELQHTRLLCLSLSPGVCSNSRSIESVISSYHRILCHPFSYCPESFPESEYFPMSWLFTTGGQSIEVSTSVLPTNIQGWFLLGLTGLISLLSKGLSRGFSSTTVQKHQFFSWASAISDLRRSVSNNVNRMPKKKFDSLISYNTSSKCQYLHYLTCKKGMTGIDVKDFLKRLVLYPMHSRFLMFSPILTKIN